MTKRIIAALLCLLAGRWIALKYEKRNAPATGLGENGATLYHGLTLKRAVVGYAVNATAVVGAAIFLPRIAEAIAMTGLVVGGSSTDPPESVADCLGIRLASFLLFRQHDPALHPTLTAP